MKRDSRNWHSPALGHEMTLHVYGHGGQPVLTFPSQDGRATDWEGFGMVGACAELLEAGRITFVSLDSIDGQSWTNQAARVEDRARRHEDYDRYLVNEVLPFVRSETGRETVWATGCSMGAYHAANIFFRHPDMVDGLIAISGLYQPQLFVGDHSDDAVYYNSPLHYLPNLDDPWYLERFRRSRIVFAVGQGRWEEECLTDTRRMQAVLEAKGIPATFDYWGHDVDHDWSWWRRMLPHHLERLGA